jgi:hypothetical protein
VHSISQWGFRRPNVVDLLKPLKECQRRVIKGQRRDDLSLSPPSTGSDIDDHRLETND